MKTRTKVALVTAAVGIPAFFLGPVLFPPADVGVEPTAGQIPFFIFLAVGDALLLGLGVSFLLFGFPVISKVSPDSKVRAWAMYLSIGYLMVSWWPHLGMHASNPIPDSPANRSLNRLGPVNSSRTSSNVHRSPTTSRALATVQY